MFDAYGRFLNYGLEPHDVDCNKRTLKCTVTKWERRKFRTKDEEIRQKQIVADRQATMDSAFGSEDPDKKRKKRMEKENRARCKVYRRARTSARLEQTNVFPVPGVQSRGLPTASSNVPAASATGRTDRCAAVKKLYRHTLAVHPDKLPQLCKEKTRHEHDA